MTRNQRKIIERIRRVRRAGDRASRSNSRFAEYRYLRAVLRAYEVLSNHTLLSHFVIIAPCQFMTPVRADSHPIRVIIDATCTQPDLRMRSRWTRALEFAVQRNVTSGDLPKFIKANGGISGCADLASKTKT
jgi:hypothetical protein